MNVLMYLGWTQEQWTKAEDYHNLCQPSTPEKLPPIRVLACNPRFEEAFARVAKFWNERRPDEPCEVTILRSDEPPPYWNWRRSVPTR